jgi:hypothetical protein
MKNHWRDLLALLDYKEGERIIDIGGGMDPVPIADQVVDIMDFGLGGKAFTQLDLCCDRLPFPDKSFDICICSQTLEDLASPSLAIIEMNRVAKRGIIEVPHRGPESVKTSYNDMVDKPPYAQDADVWCYGTEHHKWLIEHIDGELRFIYKNPIYLMMHPIPKWCGQTGIRYQWKGMIRGGIAYDIDPRLMHQNYFEFRERTREFWDY